MTPAERKAKINEIRRHQMGMGGHFRFLLEEIDLRDAALLIAEKTIYRVTQSYKKSVPFPPEKDLDHAIESIREVVPE